MNNMFLRSILAVCCFCLAFKSVRAEASGRDVLAVVGSIYPGFGVGQAIQGRYMETGIYYTIAEFGIIAVAALSLSGAANSTDGSQAVSSALSTAVLFGGAFLVVRILSIVDVASNWGQSQAYNWQFGPIADSTKVGLGASLHF